MSGPMHASQDESPAADVTPSTHWYAWYVVIILAIASALSYLDRQVITLVVEPIKQDLTLTDFQVSLLMGPAFVLFYVTMGLPLGWMADRYPRRILIAAGIFLWSLATAA